MMNARCFRVVTFSGGDRVAFGLLVGAHFQPFTDASFEVLQAADFELFEVVRPERFELPAY